MNNILNESVNNYINEIYLKHKKSNFIEELRIYGEENSVPIIHRDVAEFIKIILKIYRPKNILEIGTAIGFSSIYFANYSEANIITLEINEDMYNIAQENISKYGFKDRITVILGDALETLPHLINNKYDLVFIDAAKGQYIKFFELVKPLLNEKAVILSDNVLYKGMIANDELVFRRNKTIVSRIRKYLDNLLEEKGLYTSVLSIGDGLAISYKED